MRLIKHENGIPLLLKAILTPTTTVQVIADFDVETLASVPAYYAQESRPPFLQYSWRSGVNTKKSIFERQSYQG